VLVKASALPGEPKSYRAVNVGFKPVIVMALVPGVIGPPVQGRASAQQVICRVKLAEIVEVRSVPAGRLVSGGLMENVETEASVPRAPKRFRGVGTAVHNLDSVLKDADGEPGPHAREREPVPRVISTPKGAETVGPRPNFARISVG